MEFFTLLSQICNGIVSIALIIALFLALVYYISVWAEEHMKKITQLLQLSSMFAFFISFLLLFTNFSTLAAGVSIVTNLMWTILLFTGFPYIQVTRPDFLIALLFTAFNHFGWMIYFLESEYSSTFVVFSFILYVWQVPILAVASLSALDENDSQKYQSHSAWTNVFKTLSKAISTYIPHAPKFE